MIKALVGLSRVGKSVLLEQVREEIRALHPEANLVFINFEFFEHSHIKTAVELNAYILEHSNPSSSNYIFIDEVQYVHEFELVVNSLRSKGNFSIFITSASSSIFSGNLFSLLSGRVLRFFVSPLTFAEMVELNATADKQALFDDYIKWGSLPGRFAYQSENEIYAYLSSVYDSIVLRGIVEKADIRNVSMLESIIQILKGHIGRPFSAGDISKSLKAASKKASPETVYNYVKQITASFLFNKVRRYDIAKKQELATQEKYYVADLGLLQFKSTTIEENYHYRLENLVYNELLAKGYSVRIGRMRNAQIDFITEKNGKREYIQVAWEVQSKEDLMREIDAFRGLRDIYPKTIISTSSVKFSQAGITHWNVVDWLLREDA